MKKVLSLALISLMAAGAQAQEAEKKASNKPVFTTIKENPITSIKDQNRSGTCWDYSTISFFEAEILKATGKTYDLCESFVANKTYMERATQVRAGHNEETRYRTRGHHAFPRFAVWRLTEQLQ